MASTLVPGGGAEGPARPAATFRVRERRGRDLPACVRLLRVVHTHDRYPLRWPERPRAWLAEEGIVDAWIAERLGEVLGHVAIGRAGAASADRLRWREVTGRPLAELGFVTRLFVRPRVRGQGVGGTLLDVAAGHVRARGLLPAVEVPASAEDAAALVEAHGWRLVATDGWRQGQAHGYVHRYVAR